MVMFDWLIRWRFLEELSVFLAMRSNGFYTIPSWSRSFTLMYINTNSLVPDGI